MRTTRTLNYIYKKLEHSKVNKIFLVVIKKSLIGYRVSHLVFTIISQVDNVNIFFKFNICFFGGFFNNYEKYNQICYAFFYKNIKTKKAFGCSQFFSFKAKNVLNMFFFSNAKILLAWYIPSRNSNFTSLFLLTSKTM